MKIFKLLCLILIVISCQAKFNSHINQKDLPEKKKQPNGYEWKAFKAIVFNRDVNPFWKLSKSFSTHAEKRKEKAEKKKSNKESKNQPDKHQKITNEEK